MYNDQICWLIIIIIITYSSSCILYRNQKVLGLCGAVIRWEWVLWPQWQAREASVLNISHGRNTTGRPCSFHDDVLVHRGDGKWTSPSWKLKLIVEKAGVKLEEEMWSALISEGRPSGGSNSKVVVAVVVLWSLRLIFRRGKKISIGKRRK